MLLRFLSSESGRPAGSTSAIAKFLCHQNNAWRLGRLSQLRIQVEKRVACSTIVPEVRLGRPPQEGHATEKRSMGLYDYRSSTLCEPTGKQSDILFLYFCAVEYLQTTMASPSLN